MKQKQALGIVLLIAGIAVALYAHVELGNISQLETMLSSTATQKQSNMEMLRMGGAGLSVVGAVILVLSSD